MTVSRMTPPGPDKRTFKKIALLSGVVLMSPKERMWANFAAEEQHYKLYNENEKRIGSEKSSDWGKLKLLASFGVWVWESQTSFIFFESERSWIEKKNTRTGLFYGRQGALLFTILFCIDIRSRKLRPSLSPPPPLTNPLKPNYTANKLRGWSYPVSARIQFNDRDFSRILSTSGSVVKASCSQLIL